MWIFQKYFWRLYEQIWIDVHQLKRLMFSPIRAVFRLWIPLLYRQRLLSTLVYPKSRSFWTQRCLASTARPKSMQVLSHWQWQVVCCTIMCLFNSELFYRLIVNHVPARPVSPAEFLKVSSNHSKSLLSIFGEIGKSKPKFRVSDTAPLGVCSLLAHSSLRTLFC